jgi:hypothetical protein
MPGDAGVTVVTTLVCFVFIAREAAGASRARHSLRPLFFRRRDVMATLARNARRERGAVSPRHCEEHRDEAIHTYLLPDGLLRGACHRAALGADPLARNDAPSLIFLRCSIACRPPLLTGNGLLARFSVLVRASI